MHGSRGAWGWRQPPATRSLTRLIEIIREHNTNTILEEPVRKDNRVRRLFWFLNSQMYGQMTSIDQDKIWNELYKEWEKEKAA